MEGTMIDIKNVEMYMENNRIEAKRSLGGLPKSIWETYSAFANTLGGIILLGVEEYRDKTFHAIDLPNTQGLIDEFWQIINDKGKVSKNILTKNDVSVETIDGKSIIAIRVPRAARHERPIYIDNSLYKGSYRRGGEGDYKCTAEEVDSMVRAARGLSDQKAMAEFDLQSIKFDSFERYRKRMGENDADLISVGGAVDINGVLTPTAAGLLMFGKTEYIKKAFPDYSLRYHEGCDCIQDLNVFDFYEEAEKRFEGISRGCVDIQSSICEALANCLINTDYLLPWGSEVKVEESGITFINSGALRIDVERAMVGGVSDPANPLLKSMFKAIEVGKSVGGGIPNIYSVWEKAGYPSPILKEHFSPDKVEFQLPFKSSLEKRKSVSVKEGYAYREIVVSYLTSKISCNIKDISDLLGIDITSAQEVLEDMTYDGIIELCGNKEYKLKA